MKKLLSLVLLVAISLSLSACGKKEQGNTDGGPMTKKQNEVQKDLMEWMRSGEAVECTVEVEGSSVVMISKGEKIRIEGTPYVSMNSIQDGDVENTNGVTLTVGDWIYMWDKVSKEGMKLNVKEVEELGSEEDDEEDRDYDTWEDQVENWENDGVLYDCEKAKLADELFAEPKDVEFTDLGEMMKGFSEMGEKLEKQIESGEGIDLENLGDLLPEGMEMPEVE